MQTYLESSVKKLVLHVARENFLASLSILHSCDGSGENFEVLHDYRGKLMRISNANKCRLVWNDTFFCDEFWLFHPCEICILLF